MSEEKDSGEGKSPEEPQPPKSSSEEIQHAPVSARVPEKIGRGVFATGTSIQQHNDILVIDFVSMMVHPHQAVARVVLSATTFSQFVSALRVNLGKYDEQFGPPQPRVQTSHTTTEKPGSQQVKSAELYDQLKLPDEMLGGAFANVVMIRHTSEEFCFDFIANLFPRSVVTSRVFLVAARVPSFLESMTVVLERHQKNKENPGSPPNASPS